DSETRARVLFESASEGIVIVDRQGHIVLVNAKTEAMFGYARAELIGRPLEILVPERMRDVHARHRAGYSLDPRVRPMGQGLDLTGRGIDGNEFPVEISLSFAEEEGEPRFMAFVTDITQRKRVEEAAQRAEALHSVALLANAAAHEINNLSLAKTPAGSQVVDLSALIRRESRLDDPSPAPRASTPALPLRRPPPARSREPRLAPATRRLQAKGDPASTTQN